jgi:hypothetical protein
VAAVSPTVWPPVIRLSPNRARSGRTQRSFCMPDGVLGRQPKWDDQTRTSSAISRSRKAKHPFPHQQTDGDTAKTIKFPYFAHEHESPLQNIRRIDPFRDGRDGTTPHTPPRHTTHIPYELCFYTARMLERWIERLSSRICVPICSIVFLIAFRSFVFLHSFHCVRSPPLPSVLPDRVKAHFPRIGSICLRQ